MELRHLRYFIAVADELHFGRAAARLHISQPPLSQQIRQLEDELGTKLFLRTKRRVELTNPGRVFLSEARAIVLRAKESITKAQRAHSGESGRLSIGWLRWADLTGLPSMVGKFCTRYPDVHLNMHTLTVPEQVSALHEGRIDLGFVLSPFPADGLKTEIVMRPSLVVGLPRSHKFVAREKIEFSQLANEPYISFRREDGPVFYDYLVNLHHREGITLNIRHEADHLSTVLGLVAAGLGITLVPSGARPVTPGVVFLKISPKAPTLEIALAWRPQNESELLKNFIEVMGEQR